MKIIKPANNTTKNGGYVSPNTIVCDPYGCYRNDNCALLYPPSTDAIVSKTNF